VNDVRNSDIKLNCLRFDASITILRDIATCNMRELPALNKGKQKFGITDVLLIGASVVMAF
jgi:hypothetical protein